MVLSPTFPLVEKLSSMPDVIFIAAGSLEDPSWHQPGADLWTSSAQPWDQRKLPSLPFPRMRESSASPGDGFLPAQE